MKKQTKKQRDEEAYQAAIEAVHRLTEKQKARLLAELQDASFRLDLPDLKLDMDLSGFELNMELPELDFKLPELEKPDVCPYCGKPNRA
jgi:hypothetical protein